MECVYQKVEDRIKGLRNLVDYEDINLTSTIIYFSLL